MRLYAICVSIILASRRGFPLHAYPSNTHTRSGGYATVKIDGKTIWTEKGTTDQYNALSNGDGYAWGAEGATWHIFALGVPAFTDKPSCNVKVNEVMHVGTGTGGTDNSGGSGRAQSSLSCSYAWEC